MKAVFKKGTKVPKEIYKPVNILTLISTILGRIVCKQLMNFLIIFYRNISADLEKPWYTTLPIANVGKMEERCR